MDSKEVLKDLGLHTCQCDTKENGMKAGFGVLHSLAVQPCILCSASMQRCLTSQAMTRIQYSQI